MPNRSLFSLLRRKTKISSPRRRSPSPRRRSPSPRRRSPSPKRRTSSPKRRSPSPKRSLQRNAIYINREGKRFNISIPPSLAAALARDNALLSPERRSPSPKGRGKALNTPIPPKLMDGFNYNYAPFSRAKPRRGSSSS
jgi:hypothetical protein